MSDKQLIRKRQALVAKIEALQEQLGMVNVDIIASFDSKNIDKLETDYGNVTIAERHNFTTDLSIARSMNATKTQEVLDSKRLKQLVENGVPVPGHSKTRYVVVKG